MSEQVAVPPKHQGLPRWAWVVLTASLAANLFVVGVVARSLWPARYATAGHGPGGMLGNLAEYGRTLSPERMAIIRPPGGRERAAGTLRPLREEMRAARREAARLFAAEPFDRQAFLAAETRLQQAERAMREAVTAMVADVAERMTAGERAGFLKWRGLRGHNQGQGQGKGEGGGYTERGSAGAAKKPGE